MGILRKAVLSCLGLGLFFFLAGSFSREAAATVFIDSKHKHSPHRKVEEPRRTAANVADLQPAGDTKIRPGNSGYGSLSGRITARSAIVLDGATGEILYADSPDLPGQPASTIKILTGLLAINTLNVQERISVSQRAAGMPRSKIYLQSGKSYVADDLINAVLLSSANDASVALAEKVGGSESVFAALMTHKARELGARNTVCRNASGLTAQGQQSTARDLAIIFNEVMRNQEFATRIRKTKVQTAYGGELRNHNRALWQVSGAEGGKTGYTKAARQTYVGKFRRGNNELLVALMGSNTMWDDVTTLVEHGFFRKQQLAVSRQHYSSEIVQLDQLHQNRHPQLVVLTDRKKSSSM
jgi:serine-type D-Ala-D-Ala carboxypeptidase (penicillin-binding protein 5/6)